MDIFIRYIGIDLATWQRIMHVLYVCDSDSDVGAEHQQRGGGNDRAVGGAVYLRPTRKKESGALLLSSHISWNIAVTLRQMGGAGFRSTIRR